MAAGLTAVFALASFAFAVTQAALGPTASGVSVPLRLKDWSWEGWKLSGKRQVLRIWKLAQTESKPPPG